MFQISREMAERLKAPVLKTGVGKPTVGSNPTLPATCYNIPLPETTVRAFAPESPLALQQEYSVTYYREKIFSEPAASVHTETVLVTALGAGIGHQPGAAASAPLIAEMDTLAAAPGAKTAANRPQILVFLPQIVDISRDTSDTDDQEKEQKIEIDGRLLTLRNAGGSSPA